MLTDGNTPLTAESDLARTRALGELLGLALERAPLLGVEEPTLIVEFALPVERINEHVELLNFANDRLALKPVGMNYAVVRRLADRLRASRSASTPMGRRAKPGLAQWKKNASEWRQRFINNGLRIIWLDPEIINAGQLNSFIQSNPDGCCVGLQNPKGPYDLTVDIGEGLYNHAVPFACWPLEEWNACDDDGLQSDLRGCLGHESLQRLFELKSLAGFTRHPSTKLAILWDDPLRNPYAIPLGAEGG